MPLACVAWPAMSHAVSPVIAINDEAKTVTVKPQAVRGGLFVLEGSGGNAKWGGFVLDGAFFTRIVYDGLK
jgi:hypothetical protein